MIYEVEVEGKSRMVSVRRSPDGGWCIQVDDGPEEHVQGSKVDNAEWMFDFDGRRRSIGCYVDGDHGHVQVGGYALRSTILDPRDRALGLSGGQDEGTVSTPMPGVIVRIPAPLGSTVKVGDVVIVVEAMKMENEYKSTIDGVVTAVHVAVGQAVEANTVLLHIDSEDA